MAITHFLVPDNPTGPFAVFLSSNFFTSQKSLFTISLKCHGPFQFSILRKPFPKSGITVPLSCLQGKILLFKAQLKNNLLCESIPQSILIPILPFSSSHSPFKSQLFSCSVLLQEFVYYLGLYDFIIFLEHILFLS